MGGIQNQYAVNAYVRLSSCLETFTRNQLDAALDRRSVVQGTLMRETIHIVSRRDYALLAAAIRRSGQEWRRRVSKLDVDMEPFARRAREFFNEWPDLLALGISMSLNCYFSSNYVFIPGYVLTLVSRSPTTATCRNVPGEVDYVLTSSDISAINTRMGRMNAHIEAKANENGYAFFKLAALYDLPKINLNLVDVLFSNSPFGPNISLDGVHPSAQGQSILANTAVQAINAKYGLAIP